MIKTKTENSDKVFLFKRRADIFILIFATIISLFSVIFLFFIGFQDYQFNCRPQKENMLFTCEIKEFFGLKLYNRSNTIKNIKSFSVKETRGSKGSTAHHLMAHTTNGPYWLFFNTNSYDRVKFTMAAALNKNLATKKEFIFNQKENTFVGFFSLLPLMVIFFIVIKTIFVVKNYHNFTINESIGTIEYYDFYSKKIVKQSLAKIKTMKLLAPIEALELFSPFLARIAIGYNKIKKPVSQGIIFEVENKKYCFLATSQTNEFTEFFNDLKTKIKKPRFF